MYQILCDEYVLYDPRMDNLSVLNPRCKLETNTVGEGSFTILKEHPYYDKLEKLKSIFEVRQDDHVIFRGRMTNDSRDFYNKLSVDLEGVLGFTNDSIIAPFNFPDDFPDAAQSTNMVEYLFRWIFEQHNAQVEGWKQLKVGTVTVSDPNNYITRSSTKYDTAWGTLKSALFDSSLGGYLVIRYEDDGNYVDYVSTFELDNVQPVTFGENILDITSKSDASGTYSAILPIGAEMLTLSDLPDGDLDGDLVKVGKFIYSKSAREQFGWICVPPEKATWDDVTDVNNLKNKAMEYLTGTAMLFSGTITIKAVDLSFTDEMIQSFRINRNITVNSPPHGIYDEKFPLTKLDIDMHNSQNTIITIGEAVRTLVDINRQTQAELNNQSGQGENIQYELQENRTDIVELQNQFTIQATQLISDCNTIIMGALESYVETSNFEEYQKTVSTQLQILSDEILMQFTTATEHIVNVDGDLQGKFTELYKYISFANGDIRLGSSENAITLTVENDLIVFKKNGLQFGWWDGVDFHTGNIVVELNERAQFGNFAFVPRSDGSLMLVKVGG